MNEHHTMGDRTLRYQNISYESNQNGSEKSLRSGKNGKRKSKKKEVKFVEGGDTVINETVADRSVLNYNFKEQLVKSRTSDTFIEMKYFERETKENCAEVGKERKLFLEGDIGESFISLEWYKGKGNRDKVKKTWTSSFERTIKEKSFGENKDFTFLDDLGHGLIIEKPTSKRRQRKEEDGSVDSYIQESSFSTFDNSFNVDDSHYGPNDVEQYTSNQKSSKPGNKSNAEEERNGTSATEVKQRISPLTERNIRKSIVKNKGICLLLLFVILEADMPNVFFEQLAKSERLRTLLNMVVCDEKLKTHIVKCCW